MLEYVVWVVFVLLLLFSLTFCNPVLTELQSFDNYSHLDPSVLPLLVVLQDPG